MSTASYTSARLLPSMADKPLNRLRLFLALAMVLVACSTAPAGSQGKKLLVTGMVTDAFGSPLPGSFVLAVPMNGNRSGRFVWTPVNNRGEFSLSLPPGRYLIRAKAEDAGYPDPNFLLSADSTARFPEISVGNVNVSGIQVSVGAQGGLIEGRLLLRETQQPVPKGKVTIRDATNPTAFVELTTDEIGHFAFAVPRKPVTICASGAGYPSTCFEGGREILLSGGERLSLTLELAPATTP